MLRYALLRIFGAIPTLLVVIALAFLMVHAAPGGPFDADRVLSPEIEKNIARAYKLDESLPQQFVRYLDGLLHGDLGPSYRYRDYSVSELIGNALPVTLELGLLAMLLAVIAGIAAGLTAALSKNSYVDRLVTGIAMTGISVPVFVVAPVMVLVFAVYLQWLPSSGRLSHDAGLETITNFVLIDSIITGNSYAFVDGVKHLIMPVIALATIPMAIIARMTRSSMLDVLQES